MPADKPKLLNRFTGPACPNQCGNPVSKLTDGQGKPTGYVCGLCHVDAVEVEYVTVRAREYDAWLPAPVPGDGQDERRWRLVVKFDRVGRLEPRIEGPQITEPVEVVPASERDRLETVLDRLAADKISERARLAGEVERLREEHQVAVDHGEWVEQENDRLRSEVERLNAYAEVAADQLRRQNRELSELRAEAEDLRASLRGIDEKARTALSGSGPAVTPGWLIGYVGEALRSAASDDQEVRDA